MFFKSEDSAVSTFLWRKFNICSKVCWYLLYLENNEQKCADSYYTYLKVSAFLKPKDSAKFCPKETYNPVFLQMCADCAITLAIVCWFLKMSLSLSFEKILEFLDKFVTFLLSFWRKNINLDKKLSFTSKSMPIYDCQCNQNM